MKNCILIDPFNYTITETKIDSLEDIYEALNVQMIEVGHQFENGDVIYVDEEGLLKIGATNGQTMGFRVEGSQTPLVGKGLIVGTTSEGADASCKTTLDEAQEVLRILKLSINL